MASAKDVANRVPITVALMLATVMNSLDTTIANVALPHMQGSLNASIDQITWVLTSYIVAAAIMTPLVGWLSVRIGRKQLFVLSITGFTIASMLCGIAANLPEMVIFRLLQGLCGAAMIPMSQAVVLDIFPREQVPQVMAIWGAGAILGPIFGPVLGGWLTDNFEWRWVFYINLPIGALALAGVLIFMSSEKPAQGRPFDFLGFGALLMFIGGLQLVLDRGPSQDWFGSPEIWVEAIIGAIGLYVFITQTLTAEHPFFDRALAADRNFVSCTVFGFFVGLFLFSTMALLPPMMQGLMGYSVLESGLVSMPRGLGSFAAMFVVGRLIGRTDTRFILGTGMSLTALSIWLMTHFDLSMGQSPFIISGIIQGLGIGLLFVPLSTLAFATLPPGLRAEGASVYTLARNLGSSVGISVMQALFVFNSSVAHSNLAEHIDPASPTVHAALPPRFDLATIPGLEALNAEVSRQAAMVAYLDDFKLMLVMTFLVMPLILIMRTPRFAPTEPMHAAVD